MDTRGRYCLLDNIYNLGFRCRHLDQFKGQEDPVEL